MNVSYRISLRYLLLLMIVGFSTLSVMVSYSTTRSLVQANIQRAETEKTVLVLSHRKSVLENLLDQGDLAKITKKIAAYRHDPGTEIVFLTDPKGYIQASTHAGFIGRHREGLNESFDWRITEWLNASHPIEASVEGDGAAISGYARICFPGSDGTSGSGGCGFLYQRTLIDHQHYSIPTVLRAKAIQDSIGIGLLGLIFWFSISAITAGRIDRFARKIRKFAPGEQRTRIQISKDDEFARVGKDLNRLFGTVAAERHLLADSEARMKSILDTAVDAIIIIDQFGRIQSVNTSTEVMFGYPRQGMIGRNISMLMPSPYADQHDSYLRNYLTTGEKKIIGIGREVDAMRSDGTVFPVELAVSELNIGSQRSFTGIIRDITRRKQAERDAEQMRNRLVHAGRVSVLGEMVAGIAHEINQPLTAIATYVEASHRMIQAGMIDTEELSHAMKQASAQAHRGGEVVRSLRSLVKKREAERVISDVNGLIRDIMVLAEVDYSGNRSSIKLELAESLPKINADPVQIQQVVLNLIRNAVDSVKACGDRDQKISVSTGGLDADHVRIAVYDNGGGISTDAASQLFSPFFTTKQSGMGMGLSICRSIITSHGGQMKFENNPDTGVTFFVTLPTAIGEDHGEP